MFKQCLLAAALTGCLWSQSLVPVQGKFTINGSIRTRVEGWDWFGPQDGGQYGFSGSTLKLSIGQQWEKFDWLLEMQAPVLLGLPDQAQGIGAQGALGLGSNYFTANRRHQNVLMVSPKQGFLRWKGLFGKDVLRVGRFEFNDGAETTPKDATLAALKRDRVNQRLIGAFGWTHVGRSFDGAHYTANLGQTNFTAVAAIPTRGVFQADGWGQVKTAFGYVSLTRPLDYGRYHAEFRTFGLYYHDYRNILKTDNRALAARQQDVTGDIRIATYGGHFVQAYETLGGTFDSVLWAAGQAGRWGQLNHRAYSAVAEVGFQPKVLQSLRPWLRAGYTVGTGDKDPNDRTHGTFFQVLPTPRPFARTPFYNMSNTEDRYALLQIRPSKRLTLGAEFHSVRLTSARDLWYSGGGAFQPWTFGYSGRASGGAASLGNLYDLSADFNVNKHVSLTGYFGKLAGRQVTRNIYGNKLGGLLGYVEATYRF